MQGLSSLLAVSLIVLSGCIAAPTPSATDAPAPSEATTTAETGAIDGSVTTDELQPIPNAQVALQGDNRSTVSASDGSFSFSNLDPGTYTVLVAGLGYFSNQKTVSVVAGEAVKVTIILDKIPIAPPPIDDIRHYEGDLIASDLCNAGEDSPLPEGVAYNDYPIVINATSPDGLDMALTQFTVDLESVDAPGTIDIDVHFRDAEGNNIETGTTAAPQEHLEVNRVLPPGEYTLKVILCLGAQAHYKMEVKMHYELGEAAKYAREKDAK